MPGTRPSLLARVAQARPQHRITPLAGATQVVQLQRQVRRDRQRRDVVYTGSQAGTPWKPDAAQVAITLERKQSQSLPGARLVDR